MCGGDLPTVEDIAGSKLAPSELQDPTGAIRQGDVAIIGQLSQALGTDITPVSELMMGYEERVATKSDREAADQASAEAQAARAREAADKAERERVEKWQGDQRRRGRASTMLTGSGGLLGDGTSARRMLIPG